MNPRGTSSGIEPGPVAPPTGLGERVRAAYRQRWRRLRGAGAASAIVVAAVMLLPALPPGAAVAPPTRPDPTLQALDRALQAAYARGASDAELAPLWAARRHALVERSKHS